VASANADDDARQAVMGAMNDLFDGLEAQVALPVLLAMAQAAGEHYSREARAIFVTQLRTVADDLEAMDATRH